jgi:hypothetical protein
MTLARLLVGVEDAGIAAAAAAFIGVRPAWRHRRRIIVREILHHGSSVNRGAGADLA